ncbi:MAG: hypothetical protein MZV64_62460 [Ignavibacteriales bacterium]|nr:hypothetical protein [Ignavibacteriales bacterium]
MEAIEDDAALAGHPVGQGDLRLRLFRPALRVGGAPGQNGTGLCGRPDPGRDERQPRHPAQRDEVERDRIGHQARELIRPTATARWKKIWTCSSA